MLLVKTGDRLNQTGSSKCQARRLQSHQLSAWQPWVCAKQTHEGNPGQAWLLGAGCSTFYAGSSEAHEEMAELPDPEEGPLHGLDHPCHSSPGSLGLPVRHGVQRTHQSHCWQPGFAGPEGNSCSWQGMQTLSMANETLSLANALSFK